MTHRILLIDDNVEFRKSLASHLRSQPGFVVVGELSSDEALFRAVRSAAPDVVLLDIAMPEMDAAAIIRRLRQAVPTAKVIGLSIVPNRRYQETCLYAGMHAHLRKDSPVASIVAAIRINKPSLGPLASEEDSEQRYTESSHANQK